MYITRCTCIPVAFCVEHMFAVCRVSSRTLHGEIIGCLHHPANFQQTSSITFAGRLLDRVNTPLIRRLSSWWTGSLLSRSKNLSPYLGLWLLFLTLWGVCCLFPKNLNHPWSQPLASVFGSYGGCCFFPKVFALKQFFLSPSLASIFGPLGRLLLFPREPGSFLVSELGFNFWPFLPLVKILTLGFCRPIWFRFSVFWATVLPQVQLLTTLMSLFTVRLSVVCLQPASPVRRDRRVNQPVARCSLRGTGRERDSVLFPR